jgi:hypothetical protein
MSFGSLLRRLRLLIVAIMLGVSNVIYEEDKMINESYPQTEQEQNDEAQLAFKNNG